MEIWDRLDEVIGAVLLTIIAMYGMHMGIEGTAQTCVAGIIALLVVKSVVKGKGGEK